MKLNEMIFLTEDPKKIRKPKPQKLKARPRKNLWYAHNGLWRNDLNHTRKDHQLYQEENEETVYAMDPKQQVCYGIWYPKTNSGVTFQTPRLRHVSVNPRYKLKQYSNK